MRPKRISQVGVGASAPFPLDWRADFFAVGLTYEVSGTATFNVEVCGENILAGEIPVWQTVSPLTGLTANGTNNIAFPVTGLRLNVTAGTGTVTLRIVHNSGGH